MNSQSTSALTSSTNYSITVIKVNGELSYRRTVVDIKDFIIALNNQRVIDSCLTIDNQSAIEVNSTVNIKTTVKVNRLIDCKVICDSSIRVNSEGITSSVTQSNVSINL